MSKEEKTTRLAELEAKLTILQGEIRRENKYIINGECP
jgi:hypothetical protein